MNPRFLIDAIVQQTTVLLAQLSTAAGIRAPLSHVADQVFRDLAREIERQGIGRKVAADMFGLALRTYQTKLQRLEESASAHNQTLWQAVLDHITQQGAPTRAEVEQRFRRDSALAVRAVLHDLMSSGLIYGSGKGALTIYRATSESDRATLGAAADAESLAALVWVHIYRSGPASLVDLVAVWPSAEALLPAVLDRLEQEGRIERIPGGAEHEHEGARYRTAEIAIPVGSEQGWEAAVLDHFRAMATSIAHKLTLAGQDSELAHQVGGATLTFDIYEGHPQESQVRDLLQRVRQDANALWEQVKKSNQDPAPAGKRPWRVTFYFGQNIEERGDA